MLEDILKSINSNLERIAIALESEGKCNCDCEDPNPVKVKIITPEIPVSQIQQSAVTEIPTSQESFTQEQLAVAMSNAISQGKSDIIMNVLQSFGVQALTQIKTEDYNKLALTLREKGITV